MREELGRGAVERAAQIANLRLGRMKVHILHRERAVLCQEYSPAFAGLPGGHLAGVQEFSSVEGYPFLS